MPFLWDNAVDVYKAQKYCHKVYESVLESISIILNDYLKINQDKGYYHIILGNWLIHFIHQGYDKFSLFNKAKELGDITTLTLNEEDYIFPLDFIEYSSFSEDDLYHLQLFSQLAKIMNIENNEIKDTKLQMKKEEPSFKTKYRLGLKKILNNFKNYCFANFSDPHVIVVGPYFKKHALLFEIQLWIKSKRKIIFNTFNYFDKNSSIKIDHDFRNSHLINSKKFENLILGYALKNIPIFYLENHLQNKNKIKNLYKNQSLSFFTYNDLYHNAEFQFYLALKNKEHKIMSAQHGCGYGMDKSHEGERYERKIVKTFFTYGWTDSSQTKTLPMPKLLKEDKKTFKNNNILFLTTTRPRYINRFNLSPNSTKMIKDHVEYPITFLKNINKLSNVKIRHHSIHDIRKWNNRGRINSVFPNLEEDKNKSFYKSLSLAKIFVSDHIGTTFLEAIQTNKPSVVFINKNTYLFRDGFKPFVDELVKYKILFYNPKKASEHINLVYSDINKWWGSKGLQSLRKDFINSHAFTSDNWMDEWCDKLLN